MELAAQAATRSYALARKAPPFLKQQIDNLRKECDKELETARKDNDLIYHKDVPAATSLQAIPGAQAFPIPESVGLERPEKYVGSSLLFGDLLAYGARAATGKCQRS